MLCCYIAYSITMAPKRKRLSDAPEPKQAVNWAWNLHNWTEEERLHITQAACVYMRFCQETCPKTGRPHLQGMICVDAKVVRSTIQRLLVPNRHQEMHCKPCYASLASNLDYCAKPPALGVFEKGLCPDEPIVPGTANERADVLLKLAEAGDFETLRNEHQSAWLYHKKFLIEAYGAKLNVSTELDGVLDNWWIWGDAGAGKDLAARQKCHAPPYVKSANTKWWCRYAGQEDVILADFDKPNKEIEHLFKLWSDRWPFQAEWKGGGFQIRPHRLYVTSGHHPRDFFGHDQHLLDSVMRRFQIAHLDAGFLVKEPRLMIVKPPPFVEISQEDYDAAEYCPDSPGPYDDPNWAP